MTVRMTLQVANTDVNITANNEIIALDIRPRPAIATPLSISSRRSQLRLHMMGRPNRFRTLIVSALKVASLIASIALRYAVLIAFGLSP